MLLKSDGNDSIETQQTASRIVINEVTDASGTARKPARTASFGPFELDLEIGELRKAGTRVRLQNKPFQILRALIQQHGEVVTRDQLRHHVWPDDTFVDFESGLNTAANRLRVALNDSAENPQYIETLPRIGYRFIAPVQFHAQAGAVEFSIAPAVAERTPPTRHRIAAAPPLSIAAVLLFTAGAMAWRHYSRVTVAPSFHQLTFRAGYIDNARFTPTGEIVFSAIRDEESSRLYVMNVMSPEARQLPFGQGTLASVSPSSEISFLHKVEPAGKPVYELAAAPLYGGASRVLLRDVKLADLGPHGEICVVRRNSRGYALEYPPGKVLYETSAWLGNPRLSPDGSRIAVAEHPLLDDDSGFVLVIGRDGKVSRVSDGWGTLSGVAWSRRGDEIWFSGAKGGINRQLYAVDLSGHLRRVAAMPAALDLFDIGPSGTVLVGRSTPRVSMLVGDSKTLVMKDISWLDWSRVAGMSADGNKVLFDETGEGGGPSYSVYLNRRDRGTIERIGNGRAFDISQDGAWILTGTREPSSTISLISAEDAKTKSIAAPGFVYQSAYFLGNSRDLLVQLSQASGSGQRVYVQNIDTGALREIPNSGALDHLVVSPGGGAVASCISPKEFSVTRLPNGDRTVIETAEIAIPVSWASENVVVVGRTIGDRIQLDELDITTKKRRRLMLLPSNVPAVFHENMPVILSTDLSTFAFSWLDHATTLFTADGWS